SLKTSIRELLCSSEKSEFTHYAKNPIMFQLICTVFFNRVIKHSTQCLPSEIREKIVASEIRYCSRYESWDAYIKSSDVEEIPKIKVISSLLDRNFKVLIGHCWRKVGSSTTPQTPILLSRNGANRYRMIFKPQNKEKPVEDLCIGLR